MYTFKIQNKDLNQVQQNVKILESLQVSLPTNCMLEMSQPKNYN